MPKSKKEDGSSGSQPAKKATRVRIRRPASASSTQAPVEQKPSQLLTLSVDIFTELCTRMTPLDLLMLCRTSKQLRATLLNVENRYIWASSRKYHGIPDPRDPRAPKTPTEHDGSGDAADSSASKEMLERVDPNEVSEPYYASFLFEPGCQNPGCTSAECPIWDSDWKYLVRYCESCSHLFEITQIRILNEWDGTRFPRSLLACIPWDPNRSGDGESTCLRTTYENFQEQFSAARIHTKAAVEQFILGVQQEFDNRQMRGHEIALWVRDAEKSGVHYPYSIYHGRQEEIRKRLLKDGCDLNKPYFSEFSEFSDNNPTLSSWNDCARRTRQITPTEWRKIILPLMKSSLREYQKSLHDVWPGPSPDYVWKYLGSDSERYHIPPTRNFYTGEWE